MFNPTTIAQSGLQEFGYFYRTHSTLATAGLANAIAAADWLVFAQDPATGEWRYDYPFSVGGMGIRFGGRAGFGYGPRPGRLAVGPGAPGIPKTSGTSTRRSTA